MTIFEQLREKHRHFRDEFKDTILSKAPRRPDIQIAELARMWKKVSNADWVWFWMYNQYSTSSRSNWVLVSKCGDDPICNNKSSPCLDENSLIDYCTATKLPEYIFDSSLWLKHLHGHTFRATLGDQLKNSGARRIDCVPFESPAFSEKEGQNKGDLQLYGLSPNFRGAICLHYKDETERFEHPKKSLARMAKLTSLLILASYEILQQELFYRLNATASRYLADLRAEKDPLSLRQEYFGEVAAILDAEVGIDRLSVVMHDSLTDKLLIKDTTGLWTREQKLNSFECQEVTYEKEQGRTGRCFSQQMPIFAQRGDHELIFRESPPYTLEVSASEINDSSFLLVPILIESRRAEKRIQKNTKYYTESVGVLRCISTSRHKERFNHGIGSIEIQILSFVGREIAPVYLTFQSAIEREDTVRIIKHDLRAPLKMIRDCSKRMIDRYLGSEDSPNSITGSFRYDLLNIGKSALLAANLAIQLDIEPEKEEEYKPKGTRMEGDIVASIKSMLHHLAMEEKEMDLFFLRIREVFPSEIYVDRQLIERVLTNLIINAIKYGDEKSTIKVQGRDDGNNFIIDVINRGIGVPESERDLIFKRRYRSKEAKREAMGVGLGLFISKSIMVRHGGDLVLTDGSRRTIFSMIFPHFLRNHPNP